MDAESAASLEASVAPERMSVSAARGVTEVQVIPSGASSRASDRVKPRTAALAAEYGVFEKTPPPCWAETEDMVTTRPYLFSIMSGTKARTVRKVPVELTANTCSHSSGVTLRNGTGEATPAIVATAPTGGRGDAWTAACNASTDSTEVTSTCCARTGASKSSVISAAVVAAASLSRSAPTTAQPSAA